MRKLKPAAFLYILALGLLPTLVAVPEASATNSPAILTPADQATAQQEVDPLTILCLPNVQDAHQSEHVKGTINVVSTWACQFLVSGTPVNVTLTVTTDLFNGGTRVASNTTKSYVDVKSQSANAAVACAPGSYSGVSGVYAQKAGWAPASGYGYTSGRPPFVVTSCP